ncbi:DEAD/DEAH box helicase [Vagococcus sp.]|uniref:DEAD/DEAH box helicase n=1 Tax=Vagococcus sp. TaxID=1933889 RepID=UPI003F98A513
MKWSIPEKIVEEGRDYAKTGRVVSISKNEEQQVWYAEVLGTEVFHIELDGTAKEEDVCQCIYWQQHGFCKHTVATELALREQGLNRYIKKKASDPKSFQAPSQATIFSRSFSRLQEETIAKDLLVGDKLVLEWFLEIVEPLSYHPEQAVIGLYLKIGHRGPGQRTYIVRNISEFLESYVNKGLFQLADRSFTISEYSFMTREVEWLERLVDIHRNNQMLNPLQVQQKGKINKRFLILDAFEARFFIEGLMEDQRLMLVYEKEKFETLYFKKEKPPIHFRVTPVGLKDYQLHVHHGELIYLENYQWIISGHSIYQLTHYQVERYELLQQLLKRVSTPKILFTEKMVGQLFSYILPSLESIGVVEVSEELDAELLRVPLKARVYLIKDQEQLAARVDYCYGDYIFSTDEAVTSEQSDKARIIRDQVRELQLETILEHFNFVKRQTAFYRKFPVGEELYHFFRDEIPMLEQYAEVTLSDAVSEFFVEDEDYEPKISILDEGSWLDIQFDITNIDEVEVNEVLVSLLKQEEYHQLKSGQLLMLESHQFKEASQVIQQLRQDIKITKGHLTIPKHRSLLVNQAIHEMSDVTTSSSFDGLVENLRNPDDYEVALPVGLKATLRDYQKTGFKWLKMLSHYHFGGVLADDMGLGKTVQMIAYLLSEKEEGALIKPSLIVAPASLLYNWQIEIKKFAPTLRVAVISGAKEERQNLISSLTEQGVDVLITSYSTARQDEDLYKEHQFHSLVLDEAQMVKNAATKTFQALESIKADHHFALSGTPIENRLDDLWALFRMIMPGFFPPIRKFRKLPTETIAMMIQPFVLRRDKKTVLKDLPDKIETDLYSQLSEEQKTVYLAYLKQMQEQVIAMDDGSFNKNKLSILAGLTRLRQICCHPGLFLPDYKGDSGKMNQLLDIVANAKSNGRRILLFSQFTGMLSMLEESFDEMGIETFYLRGSTAIEKRQEMVDRFNRGERDLFLISLKAGGTGLNLTGADTVILYDLWWNPAVEDQATGRAHRMGQTKKVEVFRLMSEGTIEEKMNQLQLNKKELFNQVMDSETVRPLSSLTMDDLKTILDIGS